MIGQKIRKNFKPKYHEKLPLHNNTFPQFCIDLYIQEYLNILIIQFGKYFVSMAFAFYYNGDIISMKMYAQIILPTPNVCDLTVE